MKVPWMLVFALTLVAAKSEETEWYDFEGQLVAVEGPGAEPAEVPFVAEWRKREIERREAYSGNWTSEIMPVWSTGYRLRRNYFSSGYRVYGGYRSGIRVHGGHYGGYYRSCPSSYRGGASVIIRW
jgi:hypothetical protein